MADPTVLRHLAVYLPSLAGGGAERVMLEIANGLAARGHQVDLVLAQAAGPYLTEVSRDVQIVDLKSHRVLASVLPLARYFARARPYAVLSALNHANVIAVLARAISQTRPRLVVSERSSPSRVTSKPVQTAILHGLMRIAYARAEKIVAVSQGVAAELVGMGMEEQRVVAIPNPVDVDSLSLKAAISPEHAWFDPGQPPVILAVGRLSGEKDYPTLIEAFRQLRELGRRERLVVLGEGPCRPTIEALISAAGLQDSVQLLGFQNNPFKFMARCGVYVLASTSEGFPNSLVQAMACGAKVVSTDCPNGPREILEGGVWGRLTPVSDPSKLADALAAALDDQNPPRAIDRARTYQPEMIVDAYLTQLTGGL